MNLGKCPGFDQPCGEPAEWTVEGTPHRDEWNACERHSRDALLYTHADVIGSDGVRQQVCREGGWAHDHLICPATEAA